MITSSKFLFIDNFKIIYIYESLHVKREHQSKYK